MSETSCEEYKEQAKGIVDNSFKAAIGVGLVGIFIGLGVLGALGVACDVTESIINDAWDCFNWLFQDN